MTIHGRPLTGPVGSFRNVPRSSLLALTIALASLAAGCDDDGVKPSPDRTGHLVIHLSDAPFPFDMVSSTRVTIDQVSVLMSGEHAAWITVDDEARTIDLLDLQGGVTDTLAEANVPVGSIQQIRLRVVDAEIFLEDGRSFPLTVPSGSTSGIKVFPTPPVEINEDLTTELLLDFDVSESFEAIPNSPTQVQDITGFHFHPVLHVANLSSSGTVEGTIFDNRGTLLDTGDDVPIPSAAVMLRKAGVIVGATASGLDGRYALVAVPVGQSTLSAFAVGFHGDSTAVAVTASSHVTADVRLSPE